jgi:SNF family Na+-dependent transporter
MPLTAGRPSIVNGLWDLSPSIEIFEENKKTLTRTIDAIFKDGHEAIYDIILAEAMYQRDDCYNSLVHIVSKTPFLKEQRDVRVLFAALTSSISLMETVVSIFMDKLKVGRKTACLIVLGISLLIGIPSSLGNGIWSEIKIIGMDFLTFFDFITNNVIMPFVAFITCILVGYVIKPAAIIEEVERNGKFTGKKLFTIVIKYIAPVCIIAILVFSVLEGIGVIKV